FSKAMEAIGTSISTASAKWGLGGSLQFGENLFGIRLGVGIGGGFKNGDHSVISESISISKSEANKIERGKDWHLSDPIFIEGETGKPIEAISEILVDRKSTGIKVFSGVIEKPNSRTNGVESKSDRIWKSQ